MTPWPLPLLASAVAFAGAAALAPSAAGPADPGLGNAGLTDWGRVLARPAVLPALWSAMARHSRAGELGAAVARGRRLMQLLPEWTDGHVYVADLLAFEGVERAVDAGEAADRLLTAVAMLEDAAARRPDQAGRLLLAAAVLLRMRAEDEPTVGAAVRDRTGQTPLHLGEALIERARARDPGLDAEVEHGYVMVRMIGLALTQEQPARARRLATRAARLFRGVEPRLAAEERAGLANAIADLSQSLDLLVRWLDGDPAVTRAQVAAHPLLAELLP